MDKQTKLILKIIFSSTFITSFLFIMLGNNDHYFIFSIITTLIFASTILENKFITKHSLKLLIFYVQLTLISILSLFDISNFYLVYTFLIIAHAILLFSKKYSLMLSAYSYIINSILFICVKPNALLSSTELLLLFIIVYSVIYITQYQINQRQKLLQILTELNIRTNQLENANIKLQKTSVAIEEMAILKERNKITREIHDTVGHTLTTVLVELEAAKRLLLKKNSEVAIEKLSLAQEQVRKGLNDIRHSVSTLNQGGEIMEFIPSMQSLIKDTIRHTGIKIDIQISDIPKISDHKKKLLFNALQEGLTNGIKHGNATTFTFLLSSKSNNINFILSNNGSPCKNFTLGFGLTAMKERVQEANGTFCVTSHNKNGFCINIILPIED